MKETIFKVGDKVFDHRFGWGEVKDICEESQYPIGVKFVLYPMAYTEDGRVYEDAPKSLSFTEYTLDGFSQERLPEKGQVVWAKTNDSSSWSVTHFINKVDEGYECSSFSNLLTPGIYDQITTKNPNK